jgi:type I restriction enzyme, S subunit
LATIKKAKGEDNGPERRGTGLPPVGSAEQIHPIPKSWTWARLGDLCTIITDGTHLTPRYVEEGRPFLSAQNIKPFRFMPERHRKVSDADYKKYVARVEPKKGDILMTRVGAMIGEAAIIDQNIDFAFYVSLCLIKPIKRLLHVPYLLHWINSPYGVASAKGKTLGKGHSQGNLNLNLIRRFPVPLPPQPEQLRIVDYLEELRTQTENLMDFHKEIDRELDAILPAILDRAFLGEL